MLALWIPGGLLPLATLLPLADAASWAWGGARLLVAGLGLLVAIGTLLSLTRLPQWPVRVWDFPRLQIAIAAAACGVAEPLLAMASGGGVRWYDWTFSAAMLAVTAWQAWRIREYTPLAGKEIHRGTGKAGDPNAIRIVISNVLESNQQHDRWRQIITAEDPDVVVAAEVNERWVREIDRAFAQSHPHRVARPQDNCYGMAMWSRLVMEELAVEFIVQDDIPSIHCTLRLRDGTPICIHSLHPRPPAPQEGDSSAPRDAELVIVGRRIREQRERGRVEPTLVVGDLNDVAWSRTTELFQRLSGLLDPRRGRGFYNTFNADSRIMRFPLDHVFISREFRLLDLRVLGNVGSDHFPISITLSLEPEKQHDQPEMPVDAADEQEADTTVQTQAERERDGQEAGHVSQGGGAEGSSRA